MTPIETTYLAFVVCINERKWGDIGTHLNATFVKNDKQWTPKTFAARNESAGDIQFQVYVVAADEGSQTLASTVLVTWRPPGPVMGIESSHKTITFVEKQMVWFAQKKISRISDLSDREAIYRQLSNLEALYSPDVDVASWPKEAVRGSLLSQTNLESIYRAYIGWINDRTTKVKLEEFVHSQLIFNGMSMSLDAYGDALRGIASAIPDLAVEMDTLVIDERRQRIGARLITTGTATTSLLGIEPADGEGQYYEYAIYQFRDGKIALVWSVGSWGSYLQAVPKSISQEDLW